MSALEEARAIERRMQHFGWNQEQAAEHLGLARSTVSNKLRLLKLPDEVLEYVASGDLSERQAMAILPTVELEKKEGARVKSLTKNQYGWHKDSAGLLEMAKNGASADKLRRKSGDLAKAVKREKKEAAEEAKRKKEREAARAEVADAGGELIDLSELGYGDYEEYENSWKEPPAGCSTECECFREKAITGRGDVISVCINPGHRNALRSAETKTRRKAQREQIDEWRSAAAEHLRGLDTAKAWRAIFRVFAGWGISGVYADPQQKAAAALELPEGCHESRSTWEKRSGFQEAFEALPDTLAVAFALMGRLESEWKIWVENSRDDSLELTRTVAGALGLSIDLPPAPEPEPDDEVEQEMVDTFAEERSCRECGCTDDDCSQCVEATGDPCYWVEDDLCSRCAAESVHEEPETVQPEPESVHQNGEAVHEPPAPPDYSALRTHFKKSAAWMSLTSPRNASPEVIANTARELKLLEKDVHRRMSWEQEQTGGHVDGLAKLVKDIDQVRWELAEATKTEEPEEAAV